MTYRPIVGITMGDPAGNGPELSVKALGDPKLYERCRPLVVGDAGMIRQAAGFVHRGDLRIHPVSAVSEAVFEYGTIDVYDLSLIPDPAQFRLGEVSAEGGSAAFESVKKVIELAMTQQIARRRRRTT